MEDLSSAKAGTRFRTLKGAGIGLFIGAMLMFGTFLTTFGDASRSSGPFDGKPRCGMAYSHDYLNCWYSSSDGIEASYGETLTYLSLGIACFLAWITLRMFIERRSAAGYRATKSRKRAAVIAAASVFVIGIVVGLLADQFPGDSVQTRWCHRDYDNPALSTC